MPDFRPNEHYVRWMKRFGILPDQFDAASDPIDVYQTDEAYWRSAWHQPSNAASRNDAVAATPWQSSPLDGKIVGVCNHLNLKNPSFEEPDVLGHSSFRVACGDVAQSAPAGWKASTWKNVMSFSQGRCTLAPYTRDEGKKADSQRVIYSPAATAGKQVAKMWVGRRSKYVAEDVTHTWLYQRLGTIDEDDVGKTLELAADVASRETYPANCPELPKDGASITVAFAIGVSESEPGLDVGRVGRVEQLLRDHGTRTLTARLTIESALVGRELAVRLSVADPEPSPGFGCHYHFDNVRCQVVETAQASGALTSGALGAGSVADG